MPAPPNLDHYCYCYCPTCGRVMGPRAEFFPSGEHRIPRVPPGYCKEDNHADWPTNVAAFLGRGLVSLGGAAS